MVRLGKGSKKQSSLLGESVLVFMQVILSYPGRVSSLPKVIGLHGLLSAAFATGSATMASVLLFFVSRRLMLHFQEN